jgi:hypothetical protein
MYFKVLTVSKSERTVFTNKTLEMGETLIDGVALTYSIWATVAFLNFLALCCVWKSRR